MTDQPEPADVPGQHLRTAVEHLLVGAAYGAGCRLTGEQCQALFAEIERLRAAAAGTEKLTGAAWAHHAALTVLTQAPPPPKSAGPAAGDSTGEEPR